VSDTLQNALAAAAGNPPRRAPGVAGRVALVAGANGRYGEALLNQLLGCGEYAQVVALADAPMALGMRNLALAAPDALPHVDDAYLLVGAAGDAGARSFYGRDAPFVQVLPETALAVARRAVDAGARRMVLVMPTSAWQQMGNFHRGLGGGVELAVSQLPLESLSILRPVVPATSGAGSLLQRIANVYLSVQMLMMPRSIPTMTSQQIARAILAAMRASTPGVAVLAADALQSLLDLPPHARAAPALR